MLRILRENTGNWIIKILLGIIVVAFVFIGMGSLGTKNRNTVATVNDTEITISEYQESYKRLLDQMRARFGENLNEDLLKMLNLKEQVLNQLIEERLIAAEAEKLNVKVADEEIQNQLMSVEAFKENGVFNIEKYKMVLGANQMNPEIFEAQQFRSIRDQKVIELLFDAVTVSDLEAENWFIHRNTKVVLDYLVFDPMGYTDITPADAELEAYYNENKDNYKTEPKRIARYLKFSPENYKTQAAISRAHVESYYEENQSKYNVPEKVEARHILIKLDETADEKTIEDARKQAADIYEQAKAGQDFAELAKKYSQGPSAPDGGYLGSFERGAMVKPFEDAAFSLQPGEISPPVRTQFGWHVIKVEQKFGAFVPSVDDVYKEIETQLISGETQNLAYSDAETAFEAILDGDDLEQAGLLSQLKQEVQETKAFTASGEGLAISDSTLFAAEAFKLSPDTISDILTIGTSYYLVKVTHTIEPEVQPLEQVKDRIVQDVTAKLQVEKAEKLAAEAQKQISDTQTLEQVAQKNGLTVKTTKPFTLEGRATEIGTSLEIAEAAFNLFEKNQIHPKVIQASGGFYIIALNERIIPDSKQINATLEDTRREIISAKQNQIYMQWIEELKEASDIQINTEFIN